MSAEIHREKLHHIVDVATNKALLERLEQLLSAVSLTSVTAQGDQPNHVKEMGVQYQVPFKGKLHKMIDAVTVEDDLEFVRLNIEPEFEGKDFWEELTTEEKRRIETSLEEAKDPAKLIPHNEVMEMAKGWIP